MKAKYVLLLFLSLILLGCIGKKKTTPVYNLMEFEQLDTLVVSAPKPNEMRTTDEFMLPDYKPAATRTHDLLHTALDLRFNWEKEQVLGKASLKLKPYFKPTSTVTLDAKGFDFHKIHLLRDTNSLDYSYDGLKLTVDLGKTFTRDTFFELILDYTASPFEMGGSSAITSDKGLFFINPTGEPGRPQQIWTQGETEHNSRWFPTIDKPNERCTQEMRITVEDRFISLSNGLLKNSAKNPDGTRTDYWVLDKPHAPYLFMLAIGEYAVVQEKWKDIDVEYYVEPEYRPFAKDIFPNTPEMLSFFSEKLGVPYPWPKYAQVIVRNFVSGAMENTTAVTFQEGFQRTSRELAGILDNEKTVAHELAHHWFGNLVTTESWANITLNEGFANYSEYLWLEHKYGKDEADFHLMGERNGYVFASGYNMHPLIHYTYEDKEDVFDRHSYNKGGLTLHMLRNYLGDAMFWAALNRYLTENAYTAVEADELRLAFEEVSGEDLNWFFDQWFFDQGHPELKISYAYEENSQKAIVTVEQIQNPDRMPAIFQLPATIAVYLDEDEVIEKEIWVDQRKQSFSIDLPAEPQLILFDKDRSLLAVRQEEKSDSAYAFQYFHAPAFMDRYEAVEHFIYEENALADTILEAALSDPFWGIRELAVEHCEQEAQNIARFKELALEDPHVAVRTGAMHRLMDIHDPEHAVIARKVIEEDSAYAAVLTAMDMLGKYDKEAVLEYAQQMEEEPGDLMRNAIESFYLESRDPQYLYFFDNRWNEIDGYSSMSWFSNYVRLAFQGDAELYQKTAKKLHKVGMDSEQSSWRRLSATRALNELHGLIAGKIKHLKGKEQKKLQEVDGMLIDYLQQIKSTESDPSLLEIYQDYPDPPVQP